MARIIVIGAGVAGLAVAARMASGVNDVTLLERSAAPGGSVTWAGPHTLTLPAVLRDLFVKTGGRKAGSAGSLESVLDLRPVDPVRTYAFPDGTRLALPNASRGATRSAFDAAFGPGSGEAWLRVLDHGNRAWSAIRPTLVEVPDAGRGDLWRLLRSSTARRALAPRRTLRQVAADAGVRDPRMLRVLDEYARDAGADPEHAPAILAVRPYIEHTFGAWRVVGGLTELVTAMYERCVTRGVSFRFATEVGGVSHGEVTLASGERLAADVVVAAVDAAVMARLTGAKPANVPYSASALSVRLDGPATVDGIGLPHESVLFDGGPNDGQGASGTIRLHAAAERATEWVATVERKGGRGERDGESDDEARRLAEDLAKRLGIPAAALTVRDVLTPADRERLTGTPGGSLHGPAVDSLSSAVLRSPTVHPTIKGLLHVGASARPGPGIAFAALGAWNAAEVLRPTRG